MSQMFFDPRGKGIARYDIARYPVFSKLNKHMRSLFWEPEAITMAMERSNFNRLSDAEQFVFTRNIQRQIVLDTEQGRAPIAVFGPSCTDPILENCLTTWQFFESIHSESYTHIMRSVYPNPSAIVDQIPEIPQISACAHDINAVYDRMIESPNKENLYLALIAANALEALRFYVSFGFTFNLGQRKLIKGSADIVKLIARDETQHKALSQHILKILPRDDPEFVSIIADNRDRARAIFRSAADQEKTWCEYAFSSGPILGLTERLMNDEIDYLENQQINQLGLTDKPVKIASPLFFMKDWLSNSSVQAAPQETDVPAYLSATSLSDDLDGFVPDF